VAAQVAADSTAGEDPDPAHRLAEVGLDHQEVEGHRGCGSAAAHQDFRSAAAVRVHLLAVAHRDRGSPAGHLDPAPPTHQAPLPEDPR
jgi:hypothetical protein